MIGFDKFSLDGRGYHPWPFGKEGLMGTELWKLGLYDGAG
jgi:hypothetical protein